MHRKQVLLVSNSHFIRALADAEMDSELFRITAMTLEEFKKQELQSLNLYTHIFIDSNCPEDLNTFSKLFERFPQITIIGSYEVPLKVATSGTFFKYKLKAHGIRRIFSNA